MLNSSNSFIVPIYEKLPELPCISPAINSKDYTSDNKLITIDNFKFYMIKTIGHKDDLITYYFKDENIMFVGDFIFKNDIGRCDLDGGNFNDMLKSIEKIKKYPLSTKIYPGHGEDTTLENEIENNKYFKNT